MFFEVINGQLELTSLSDFIHMILYYNIIQFLAKSLKRKFVVLKVI